MREFRKKQARLKKIMNTLVIFTAAYVFIYIGAEPMVAKAAGSTVTMILAYLCDILIVACMIVLFLYFSKYGKSDRFLESIEYELSDAGCYLTAREDKSIEDYHKAVTDDLTNNGFSINSGVVVNDFEFDSVLKKGRERFYIVLADELDKNDVIAYTDSAAYDITAIDVRRRADCVVLFICSNADEGAVSLSKMITTFGKKEQIKIAGAIVELETSRVYFLGNKPSKCQKLIANYVMDCEVPIKEQYILSEKLPFQDELEERMKKFNIKDFRNGTFYAH